ncbi:DNA polymerase III subunit delta' [Desulfuromonas versatilis]|uniref:DNA polymerase III subunit delta' n=1 Tax=Desulfuromonas versatilis TaxID=2802975 RepID=A0ABM8HT34_9BACT|nr:DNA polymerase III subunit delta' [Desulfuromonas versatilis]BCR05134.1 DNA polymerase III subunit delta' [Desulfuromonas versatilis]
MTFAQVLGHERQKDILRRALDSGRLAHAYLFEGPEGIGKRLMALAVARAVACAEGNGCGDCAACRKIDHNNHPDLHIVESEGASIKIDQVRALQKELSYRPLEAPKKICLIDGAEKMNPAAGNALLKTLEEPSGDALLILLTSRAEGVLATIRSRCQRLPFARLPRPTIQKVLLERLGVDETQGHILAALSEGSFKKALGKDRDLYLEKRRELLKALTALSTGSVLPLFDLAQVLADEKERLGEILEIFQAFYRDLLLVRHGRPQTELVNIDLQEKIHRNAQRHSVAAILTKLDAVAAARRHLDRNVNRQLAMEVLLLKLAA